MRNLYRLIGFLKIPSNKNIYHINDAIIRRNSFNVAFTQKDHFGLPKAKKQYE